MKPLAVLAFLVSAYLMVGTLQYDIEKQIEADYKEIRAKKQAQPDPGRMWSKKCLRADKQFVATQADGGKWKLTCVNAGVKA